MTTADVARLAGVTPRSLRRWVRDGIVAVRGTRA
ncbi:MerR family DNA-binding transcriptional regulator [Capillimicrobium parvum]